MQDKRRYFGLAAVLLTGSLGVAAAAEEQPADDRPEPSVGELVTALASDDMAERDAATRQLMLRHLSEEQLRSAFNLAEMPEQRHRLLRVARHQFYRDRVPVPEGVDDDHGSIGIAMRIERPEDHPTLEHGGMGVESVLAGFPAYVYLKPGDIIFAIDGKPLPRNITSEAFQRLIRSHRPGEMMSVQVLRGQERLRVRFEAGSGAKLAALHSPTVVTGVPAENISWSSFRRSLLGAADIVPPLGLPESPQTSSSQTDQAD